MEGDCCCLRGEKRETFATLIYCNCVLGVRTWLSEQYFAVIE